MKLTPQMIKKLNSRKWAKEMAKKILKRAVITKIALVLFCFTGIAKADMVNLAIISQIESHNNPLAYNQKTGASGMFQLMPCVVEEYNAWHKASKIEFKAVFSPVVARTVAEWYLTIRIPQMLKYYHKPITLENCLICYNAGIRAVVNGYLPEETEKYILKYKKIEKRGNK